MPKNKFSEATKTEIPVFTVVAKKKNNGLIWFGGLLLLALLLWYIMGSKSCNRNIDNDMIRPGITDTIASNHS